MKMKKYTFLFAASVALFSGCASTPFSNAISSRPTNVRELTQEEKDQLSYIARPMLSTEDQNKLTARITGTGYAPKAGLPTTEIGMATALMKHGTLTSTSSINTVTYVSMAVEVLGLLSGDGSRDVASGIFFPESVGEIKLTTPEQATDFALRFVDERIRKAAIKIGYEAEPITVKKLDKVQMRPYLLKRLDKPQLLEYSPPYLYLNFMMPAAGMVPIAANSMDIWALGFTPKWTSGFGNTALPFLAELSTDDQGKPRLRDGDYLIKFAPKGTSWPLGREFLRAYFDEGNGFSYYANNDRNLMAYRGKTFGYSRRSASRFIEHETSEPSLKTLK